MTCCGGSALAKGQAPIQLLTQHPPGLFPLPGLTPRSPLPLELVETVWLHTVHDSLPLPLLPLRAPVWVLPMGSSPSGTTCSALGSPWAAGE